MFADMTIIGYTISTMMMLFFAVLWICFAFWPATVAKSKGYSFWGFFILSLFVFFIALIVALIMPDRLSNAPAAAPPMPPVDE